MDYYELAQDELQGSQYETANQFHVIMDMAFNGTFSQAGDLFNRYGFSAHSYTEHLTDYCEELINDRVLVECLKDLAVVIEVANKIKIDQLEAVNVEYAIKAQSFFKS